MPKNNPVIVTRLNPPDLLQRMAKYPDKLASETRDTLEKANYHVWASVPPYPPAKPNQRYQRTGTLGRTLGSSQQGGQVGKPQVFTVRRIGQSKQQARFGTRLEYAPDVIGANTQRPLFKKRGWYTMKTIAKKAEKGVHKLFDGMSKRLVKFLDGK